MYFSLYVERKVPKERHLRKVPTVLSLRILSPDLRAYRSQFDEHPHDRQSADRAELAPFLCRQVGRLTDSNLALRSKPKGNCNHGRASTLG